MWVAAIAGLSTANSVQYSELRVERRDVVRYLTLSGELQSVDQTVVAAPRTSGYSSAPISFLAPEGSRIEAGDLLVQFDTDALESELREAEVERENARLEVARKESEYENRRQDLVLARVQAVKSRRVAEIYASLDAALMPRSELEKYRFDYEKAEFEEAKANRRLKTLEESANADLEVARLEQGQADLQVRRLRRDIKRLDVRAPTSGLVIYAENPTSGNKVQVGEELYAGWQVVYLPNLDGFKVVAFCYDADYHHLAVGAQVLVTLDALPGRSFSGVISALSRVARPAPYRVLKKKVFEVQVRLHDTDSERMRPGMTARVEVPIAFEAALAVPRAALRVGPEQEASVRIAGSPGPVPVKVIDAASSWAVVEGDLEPGTLLERVATENAEAAADYRWVEVVRTQLEITANATGTLHAARAVQVRPPSLPFQSQFKIVAMAPEGATVVAGEPVVVFDATEIERRLREDEDHLEKNRREVEKLKATQELRVREVEMELEDASVEVDRARTKYSQAEQFQGLLEVRETALEFELAEERVAILKRKLEALGRQHALQLQMLEEQRELHLTRERRHQQAAESLTVRAPAQGGLVIYETNYRNEKKYVGAQAYRREPILQLPDMSSLIVRAQIAEADAGRLRIGQEVNVHLEAFPDEVLRGRVASIASLYRRPVYNRPAKVLDFDIDLQGQHELQLRPGMAARVEVTTRRLEEGVTVPVKALGRDDRGDFVLVKTDNDVERRPVQVGEVSGPVAVILSGLQEGERVARGGLRADGGLRP